VHSGGALVDSVNSFIADGIGIATPRRQYFTEFLPHFDCCITDEVGTLGFDGWVVTLIDAVYKGLDRVVTCISPWHTLLKPAPEIGAINLGI